MEPRAALASNEPHPVDVHVGQRLRQRRTLMGVSQEKLAESLGVTFQQVQKYERGTNRIGASRLYDIGRMLEVSVAYFFEELSKPPAASPPLGFGFEETGASAFVFDVPTAAGLAPAPVAAGRDIDRRETLELVRAFNRIRDPQVRRRVYELTKALAELAYRESVGDTRRA